MSIARTLSASVLLGRRPYLIVLSGAHVGELHGLTQARVVIGRGSTADVRLMDEGVSRAHTELIVRGENVLARDLGSLNGTFHNGCRTASCKLAAGDKLALGAMSLLKFSFQDSADEHCQRELYTSAVRDALTGAMRKDIFLERLNAEVLLAVQHSAALALIVCDIDDLGRLNGLYGRLAGDHVLAAISQALARLVRHPDVFGHLGGDRFALVSRGTTGEAARGYAERLRALVASTPIRLEHATVNVTASLGVASFAAPTSCSAVDLLRVAEAALHRAKRAGKDRTETTGMLNQCLSSRPTGLGG